MRIIIITLITYLLTFHVLTESNYLCIGKKQLDLMLSRNSSTQNLHRINGFLKRGRKFLEYL